MCKKSFQFYIHAKVNYDTAVGSLSGSLDYTDKGQNKTSTNTGEISCFIACFSHNDSLRGNISANSSNRLKF